MSEQRPPGKEELAPVPDDERFRRLEELEHQLPPEGGAANEVSEEEGSRS